MPSNSSWILWTWRSELCTCFLTVAYCLIAADDIAHGEPRRTSPSWFRNGFCVSWPDHFLANSHMLCLLGDVLVGSALMLESVRRYRSYPHPNLRLAMAVSAFTVMHGFGHAFIGLVLGADFMESVRPGNLPAVAFAFYFVSVFAFLSLAPYLGYLSGVNPKLGFAIHLASTWAFLEYVPSQFAFGTVQLILNCWYCIPRILLIAADAPERVACGWHIVSFGFLALMPIVFAEMLACDTFLAAIGGHFVYDGAILIIGAFYSSAMWQNCDGPIPKHQ